MSISNYAELQTSIATWLHRSDLAAVIPDFITLAEARISSDIKARSMEVRTTLSCVPGTTIAARYVMLPSDMVEMRRLTLMTDPAVILEYKSPDQIVDDNGRLTTAGRPNCFTVIGTSLELSPAPDSAYDLELIYLQRIPALTALNTTNWLLVQSPNTYLYGALIASVRFTQDDQRLPMWERAYEQALQAVNAIDWYSGSTMRVKQR